MIICLVAVAPVAALAGPSILVEARTGQVLAADRAGEPWYPASLTKLMTAYVVFQKLRAGTLKLDQQLPVSVLAASQEPSKIGMQPGSTISVDLALQSLLVYSANDMAYVLAEGSSGTVVNFVDEMNANAKRMRLTATHFVNPNGLFDPRHLSSARDIAVIAQSLLSEFPEYAHYFSQDFVMIGKRHLMNRNSLLRQMPEADGMKTGFVCNSGFNLVASATHEGRQLIAVVLGAASGQARAEMARTLLTSGFAAPVSASHPTLAQLGNDAFGAIVPADLTSAVCKKKQPATLASAKVLGGWGVSLGIYDDMITADKALRGRLISAQAMSLPGRAGVIRIPNTKTYGAMVWNLDQPTTVALCNAFHAQNAVCDVMAPEAFGQIAAVSTDPDPSQPPVVAQGSDDQKSKRPKKRRVKKRLH